MGLASRFLLIGWTLVRWSCLPITVRAEWPFSLKRALDHQPQPGWVGGVEEAGVQLCDYFLLPSTFCSSLLFLLPVLAHSPGRGEREPPPTSESQSHLGAETHRVCWGSRMWWRAITSQL